MYNESVIKKVFFIFIFLLLISSYLNILISPVLAAMLIVQPDGTVVSKVLGDSTLQVKSTSGEIAYTNGKIEVQKGDTVEVAARANSNDLKIGTNGNQFTIEENGIVANTSFPITIDPVKNELTVTTNSGSRLLSILPFEATVVLTRGKFIDNIKDNQISLSEDSNGLLQYSINGVRNINIFNVAKVSGDVSSNVSASNGEIIKVNEPVWLRLLGVIL